MFFASSRPNPPLDAFIEHFWYFENLEVGHRHERVLPNGTFELIFNLDERARRFFPRDPLERPHEFRRAWISGTHSEYIVIDAVPGTSLMGAHFRPGGATAILGMPADELSDRVVELDALWGASVSALRDALLETHAAAGKFRMLERFLLARSRLGLSRDPLVRFAVEQLTARPHLGRIDRLAELSGVSHKHFISRFRKEVGLSPKRFCRIARFQEVLRRLEGQLPIDWADLAADCGYFDQSHFIQEFRGFAGLNPSVYLREKGEYLNFVPIQMEPPRASSSVRQGAESLIDEGTNGACVARVASLQIG